MSILNSRNNLVAQSIDRHDTPTDPLQRLAASFDILEYSDSVADIEELVVLSREVIIRYDLTQSSKYWLSQEILRATAMISSRKSEATYRTNNSYSPEKREVTIELDRDEYNRVCSMLQDGSCPAEFGFLKSLPAFWHDIDESTSQCTY